MASSALTMWRHRPLSSLKTFPSPWKDEHGHPLRSRPHTPLSPATAHLLSLRACLFWTFHRKEVRSGLFSYINCLKHCGNSQGEEGLSTWDWWLKTCSGVRASQTSKPHRKPRDRHGLTALTRASERAPKNHRRRSYSKRTSLKERGPCRLR